MSNTEETCVFSTQVYTTSHLCAHTFIEHLGWGLIQTDGHVFVSQCSQYLKAYMHM